MRSYRRSELDRAEDDCLRPEDVRDLFPPYPLLYPVVPAPPLPLVLFRSLFARLPTYTLSTASHSFLITPCVDYNTHLLTPRPRACIPLIITKVASIPIRAGSLRFPS